MKRELPGGLELHDERARVDVGALHRYLSEESYWAQGRPLESVERLVREASRVGLYVLDGYRGRGLGVELVREAIDGGPYRDLPWYLNTADAHGLYAKLGFGARNAVRMMFRPRPEA